MAHEVGETVEREGRWVNVYGKSTPNAGKDLPPLFSYEQPSYATEAEAVAAGTQDIQRAQAGKLQPAMESSIEQWVQQAKADMRARFASMGLGNSSDIASEEAKIDLIAQSMRGQLLQGEEQLGLAGVSTGVNAAIGGGQLAQNQQNLLAQLIASANQSLGVLQGRQPSA